MDPLSFSYHLTLILNSQFWLISLALLCSLPSHEARITRGNTTDRQALVAFKASISEDLQGFFSSWNETNTTLHHCEWHGVTCSSPQHPDRVTALDLSFFNLTGTLSPYLANLTFLHLLNLSTNNFHGPVPLDFGRLSRLQYLNLSYNFLEGEIPPSLTHCSQLREICLRSNSFVGQIPANFSSCLNLNIISLGYNQLTGTIPASLGSLLRLFKLALYKNQLTGGIPPSLGNATTLTFLDTWDNSLGGRIPDELGRLTNLEKLVLVSNELSGDIPPALFNISSFFYFNVGNNNLSGLLPHDMGSTLPGLQFFYAYYNHLRGSVPRSLANASGLQTVNLYGNMLVGPVPRNLGSLQNLTEFVIAENQLEAEYDVLASLSNSSKLSILALSGTNLQGLSVSSVANLSTQLTVLDIMEIQISGVIPAGIGKLNKLTYLDMSGNSLVGTIPSTIGMLENLHVLALSRNQLHGEIPTSVGNLTQLNELRLDKNEFQGSIPSSIETLMYLGILDLSDNKLNGNIPGKALSKLSSLSQFLNLSNNLLTGSLPQQIGSLINLNILDVSENRLSGEIPGSLGGCQLLGQLFMQGNFFEGIIPSALSGLKAIEALDLSRNNLSGPIPEFLKSFHLLNNLNLSLNDLKGQVPEGGVFENASAISVLGNKKICGGIQELHLQPCESVDGMSSRRSSQLKVIIPVLAAFILVIAVSATYCIRKQRMEANSLTPCLKEPFVQMSYAEIHKATNGFSSLNLIGEGGFGSVYKGIMDSDPNWVVAIKVLNLDRRGAKKSFMAECNSLRVIRHRNLVNILTVCSSIDRNGHDFKALIFEYMPNGSLDEWLHPRVDDDKVTSKGLSLFQRLNIAMDVALALDYLHHQCETPMVHCDLKPSNILLDYDMRARVGDFGLARFLRRTISSSQDTYNSIGIKGSIGYIAPEYGMGGPVTIQGDVYSYGVLLLETFTGKRPTDGIFQSDLNLNKYVEMAYPDRVLDILDPSIVLNEGTRDKYANKTDLGGRLHDCMISIFRIGLLCSKGSTNGRMEMGDVIKELTLVKKILDRGLHAESPQSKSDYNYHCCGDISVCGRRQMN